MAGHYPSIPVFWRTLDRGLHNFPHLSLDERREHEEVVFSAKRCLQESVPRRDEMSDSQAEASTWGHVVWTHL